MVRITTHDGEILWSGFHSYMAAHHWVTLIPWLQLVCEDAEALGVHKALICPTMIRWVEV